MVVTDDIDDIGLKKIILDWQISEQDRKSIRYIATQMAMEFAKNNLGRIKLRPYILDSKIEIPIGRVYKDQFLKNVNENS